MTQRILALIAILLCTTCGWIVLGTTIFSRTKSAGTTLESRVGNLWGSEQVQSSPVAFTTRMEQRPVSTTTDRGTTTAFGPVAVPVPIALERSRIETTIELEQRQKGLLWFATYRVSFRGSYVFRNNTPGEEVTVRIPFPASDAIYDDLLFVVDGKAVPLDNVDNAMSAVIRRAPGALIRLDVGYRSQGLTSWRYSFGEAVTQVRDFNLTMKTNFRSVDFPAGTMSPTAKSQLPAGWKLTWSYRNLMTGYGIGMIMPEKIQPGPLAARISYFAPVSLLFFFFLLFIVTTMRGIDLHPMNYFFLAAAFFAFHLLLGYLADHVSIHLAFLLASIVSMALVVSYLRLVIGTRFALIDAALPQLVYLVGFSYAFFFEGYTGLAVTTGSILTLFIVMQMTGRIRWSERFASAR